MSDETPDVGLLPVFYVAHDADGRIRQYGRCAADYLHLLGNTPLMPTALTILQIPDDTPQIDLDRNYYVANDVLVERAEVTTPLSYSIAADGVAAVSFSVPSGTTVLHQDNWIDVTDDTFEFASVTPGVFEFYFQSPPSVRDYTVVINAV